MDNSLKRFMDAQENSFMVALSEVKQGRKQSHWMWFIFPQIAGLGFSETSRMYAIRDLFEADRFLNHPVLGSRLINISLELVKLKTSNAHQIFGSPDDLKLQSSMTLFSILPGANPVFQQVLEKFFNGSKDIKTLALVS
jgi:uncharacterized protein (DUF1810 family)